MQMNGRLPWKLAYKFVRVDRTEQLLSPLLTVAIAREEVVVPGRPPAPRRPRSSTFCHRGLLVFVFPVRLRSGNMYSFVVPLLLLGLVCGQVQDSKEKVTNSQARQYSPYGNPASYATNLPYDPYLNHQLQYPTYYAGLPDPQSIPIRPQVYYYPEAAGPFLLNPLQPGNFLYPQPQPQPQPQPGFKVPQYPQRPVFVAGYPKPAHIPPVDRDAEEIPTDPKEIPPHKDSKPEKLELEEPEAVVHPQRPSLLNLQPGQRFFILNGQPLFANYPFQPLNDPLIFRHNPLPRAPLKKVVPQKSPESKQGILLRDVLPLKLHDQLVNKDFQSVLLRPQKQQDDFVQSRYYEKGLGQSAVEEPLPVYEGNVNPGIAYYRYGNNGDDEVADDDSDSVIIDARFGNNKEDADSEVLEASTPKPSESSVAQSQPGAIALAGPGGVAAASPKGTALAGEGGLAVSSPQATAVAGPSRDDEEKKVKDEKPSKTKKKN